MTALYKRRLIRKREQKKSGKGVPQLGEQALQTVAPLVIPYEYGSNQKLMELPTDKEINVLDLAGLYFDHGVDIGSIFEMAPVVGGYDKFEMGQPLWDPVNYDQLGTQMYLLNKWYIEACKDGKMSICVQIRDEHRFRGTDIMFAEFPELHQLCHMRDLDKTLISCYCL